MNSRLRMISRRLSVLTLMASLMLVLAAAPSSATESVDTGDEGGKLTLPESSHDRAGLIILAFMGLATLGAGANAVKQYRGERPQADGRIRWR